MDIIIGYIIIGDSTGNTKSTRGLGASPRVLHYIYSTCTIIVSLASLSLLVDGESGKLQCNTLRRKYYFDRQMLTEQMHMIKQLLFPKPVGRQQKTSFPLKKYFTFSFLTRGTHMKQLLHLLFCPFLTACFFPELWRHIIYCTLFGLLILSAVHRSSLHCSLPYSLCLHPPIKRGWPARLYYNVTL